MRKRFLAIALLFAVAVVSAQDVKYGKIDEDVLAQKTYAKDSTAGAVYLYKGRETWIEHGFDGWEIITVIHERIKIIDKSGLDYATVEFDLHTGENSKQKVEKIRGVAYNLVDGKVVETELDAKHEVYENDIQEDWKRVSFAIPNAQVGSIIEWEYRLEKPNLYAFDDLVIQEYIPVEQYHAEIRNPYFIKFNVLKKGFFDIDMDQDIKRETMGVGLSSNTGYGQSRDSHGTMSYNELTTIFDKKDIPAIKEEPYVSNIDNYRFTIAYELESYEMDEDNPKKISSTWEEVATSIFKNEFFGGQLTNLQFLRASAKGFQERYTDPKERMEAIFAYVRDNFSWNGDYGKYVDRDLRQIFKDKKGNVAEINLLLIGLLREAGLSAHPILISTRENGIPVFPTLTGYNYVIAGVQIDEELSVMDATEKLSAINTLPTRVYNWKGRLVRQTGVSQEIDLYPKLISIDNMMLMASIDEKGYVKGKVQERFTSSSALRFRKKISNANGDGKSVVEDEYTIENISDVEVKDFEDLDKPIAIVFSFDELMVVESVGDKLFLDPLLFLKLGKSPFNYEERMYPVDFVYPFQTVKNIILDLPENFEVTSLPEPTNIKMPGDLGSFYYAIHHENGRLNVLVKFSINKSVVPVEEYGALREFFKLRVAKENEKVVLERA